MLVINFKNYLFGKQALQLARMIEFYCSNAIIAVPATEISELYARTRLQIFAQHIDSDTLGRATGFILPESVKATGASGTILNHSEHPIEFKTLKQTIQRCKKLKLKTIICASSLQQTKKIKSLKPDAIAFEDPKLIATGKSITKYKANQIAAFAKLFKGTKIIPLCGAGISNAEDIKKAFDLGCKGILISSAIANNKHPEKLLQELTPFS